MACTITIAEIQGHRNESGTVTGVRVQGASEECVRIELRISCVDRSVGGVMEEVFFIDVATDGSWDEILPLARLPACADCSRPITVTATCLVDGDIINPECMPVSNTLSLPCPDGSCPDVRVTTTISSACNSDQTRNAVYNITVNAPPGLMVRTEFIAGDGTIHPVRTDRSYAVVRGYDATRPRTLHPRVRIVTPSDCPPLELPAVHIPYCEPIKPSPPDTRCPAFRRVTANLIESPFGCQVLWIAEIDPPTAGTFTWSFDGDPPEPPNRSRSALKAYGSSGRHGVEVRYHADTPSGCPEPRMTGSIDLEGCESTEGGDENTGCVIARVAMVVLLATAIVAGLLATCLPPPAPWLIASAAFAAAFILVALLWGLLCNPKPCKWLLLVTAQACYAAGLMLVNSIGCCATLGYVGAGVATLGLLLLIVWKEACNMGWCAFAREVAFVTVGVLAQVFVLLGAICGTPGFAQEPVSAAILVVFNALGIGFIAAGLACSHSTDDLRTGALDGADLSPRFPEDV